ncbi:hypothetical protein AGMMS49587_00420 [Spirochaetia bacterium]|nr:hypothetical protein AGMMS49587_00420 [Spirochaetia bacterium]
MAGNSRGYKTILPIHEGDTTDYSHRRGKEIVGLNIDNDVTAINACFANNEITDLVLPDSVTAIAPSAFQSNLLKSVKLPKGLTCIEYAVFCNNYLEDIEIPNSVTLIDAYAFTSNRLTNVKLPEGLEKIGGCAFMKNCLTRIEVPDSVTEIGADAFRSNRLRFIKLPKGLDSISDNWFMENNKIESIVLPLNLKWISDTAFKGNPITSIAIGKNLQGQQNDDDFTPALLPSATAFGIYGARFIDSYIYNNSAAGTYEYDKAADKWNYRE